MNRMLKINSEIQKAISEIITYELKNPHIFGIISVTKVDTTNDLDTCKVYVSILSDKNQDEIFAQIQHSAGFIRKTLASKVLLRKIPYLTFILDKTNEYGQNIEQILTKISLERKEIEDENK